jgi:hypothetical protein
MKEDNTMIVLSSEEFIYFQKISLDQQAFANLIKTGLETSNDKFIIRLNHEKAEQLRDLLTARLAECGFDQRYALTEEGKMLEDMIDKFYIN